MSAIYAINFHRQAYLRDLALARRRVIMLGVWVAYFGGMGVLMGLYGLNCISLRQRLNQLQRDSSRLRSQQVAGDWNVRPVEVDLVEGYVRNPRQWRDRLLRLATILPPNARLSSMSVNPQNLSTPEEANKLVVTGIVTTAGSTDRMQSVIQIVSAMQHDSVFAAGYSNIKLASTRVSDAGGAEFVVECR